MGITATAITTMDDTDLMTDAIIDVRWQPKPAGDPTTGASSGNDLEEGGATGDKAW